MVRIKRRIEGYYLVPLVIIATIYAIHKIISPLALKGLFLWIAGAFLVVLMTAFLLKLSSYVISYPLKKRIMAIHAFILDSFLHVYLLFFLAPCNIIRWQYKGEGTPILLIHGYLHFAPVWLYHMRFYKKAGLGPIYTMNLNDPFSSIEHLSENVANKVKEIVKETGKDEIYIVGHSMGGLIGSYYAIHDAPKKEGVLKVITLGSPFHGTKVANIAIGENAKEMRLNSPFVKALLKDIQKEKKIPFYNIGSKSDQLVIPQSSSFVVDKPERKLVLDGIGHVGLLFSSQAANQVVNWVKEK